MKTLTKIVSALSLVVPVAAVAAEPLPPRVADMECLVGAWRGSGNMQMGKDTANVSVSWDCKRTSAKFGVSCVGRFNGVPGVGVYEETDLMGYEPNSNTYHWYSVTNGGETHDHVAQVPTGDTIRFVFNGTQEGNAFKEVIDLTFSKDGKALKGHSETFLAGTSTSVLELNLRK
jgi:hypothetical protein